MELMWLGNHKAKGLCLLNILHKKRKKKLPITKKNIWFKALEKRILAFHLTRTYNLLIVEQDPNQLDYQL